MKKEAKQQPRLKQFCHFHEHIPATYICNNCGKSICYYCQKNYGMPYLCPECMPVWWEKKVKRERIFCFGPVLIFIIIIVSLVIYAIATEPDYDDDYDYSSIYVEDDGIIPVLNTEGSSGGNNKLDLTLKIYATNEGTKDTGKVYIELYVMQNGSSRAQAQSDTDVIKKDKTKVFFINTTLLAGNYELQLMIWENGKVVERGVKSVRINEGDIQNIKAYEILEDTSESKMAKDEGDAGAAFGGSSYILIPILIIAVIFLPIIAWVFYQQRVKLPSRAHGAGPRAYPPAYQYPPQQHQIPPSPPTTMPPQSPQEAQHPQQPNQPKQQVQQHVQQPQSGQPQPYQQYPPRY